VLYRRELAIAEDSGTKRTALIQQFSDIFATPYVAASQRLVDDIIEPAQTRAYVAEALEALANKRDWRPQKKHGLIPL
jgi:methylmalonyl-CoA carboxyltransferase large subunit